MLAASADGCAVKMCRGGRQGRQTFRWFIGVGACVPVSYTHLRAHVFNPSCVRCLCCYSNTVLRDTTWHARREPQVGTAVKLLQPSNTVLFGRTPRLPRSTNQPPTIGTHAISQRRFLRLVGQQHIPVLCQASQLVSRASPDENGEPHAPRSSCVTPSGLRPSSPPFCDWHHHLGRS